MVSICATLINACMKNATRELESIQTRARETSDEPSSVELWL